MQDLNNDGDLIEFTRASARSRNVLVIGAVPTSSDTYDQETRLFRFEHDAGIGDQWYFDDLDFDMQDITLFRNPEIDPTTDYLTYLSSEGDVFHAWWKGNFREKIMGAGVSPDSAKAYGRLLAISQIGDKLYACGQSGQIYKRDSKDRWSPLAHHLIFDMADYLRKQDNAPKTDDPGFLTWLREFRKYAPRRVSFNDVKGLSENTIYLCGEESTKPVLCFWDGSTLHELKVHLDEAALTAIYIENEDSVWVCGREGVLLHGSYARGFTPVNVRNQLNLFHTITPYRGKLVLPSSVRPGGLFEFDPATSDLTRFSPALPKLRGDYIFHAEAVNDVLWVVGQKDIFRFEGSEWERIEHPDL